MNQPKLEFDAGEQILFIDMSGIRVSAKHDIDILFATLQRFWRERCGAQKVYAVIGYGDFLLPPELTDEYAAAVKRTVDMCAITAVRHAADASARATLRVVGIKNHRPSNVYATRDEAVQVVRGLRSKQIQLD